MKIRCRYVRSLFKKQGVERIVAIYLADDFQEVEGEFVAKGDNLPTSSFLEIEFDGDFEDAKDGRARTFIVRACTATIKKSRASVLGYLCSGAIKGIGYATAKLIVDKFGLDAVDVLEQDPQRLKEISGIGEKTLEMILNSLEENRDVLDLSSILDSSRLALIRRGGLRRNLGQEL